MLPPPLCQLVVFCRAFFELEGFPSIERLISAINRSASQIFGVLVIIMFSCLCFGLIFGQVKTATGRIGDCQCEARLI